MIHRTLLFLASVLLMVPATASLAAYPEKPIRIIIPFDAGGPTDVLIRSIAPILTQDLGQNIVIENKGGAGSVIGVGYVAHAKPDGYTLVVGGSPTPINASFMPNLPYDTEKDLTAIAPLARTPYFLIAGSKFPVNSVKDLIAYAKAHPGQVTYASSGIGNRPHLAGAQFGILTGTQLLHVPFKGTAPATTALLSGEVNIMFAGLATVLPNLQAGQLKVLAVATPKRSSFLPNAPTLGEEGIPNFYPDVWYGLLAPGGTPQAIKDRLAQAVNKALKSPDTVKLYASLGAVPFISTPAQFQTFFDGEVNEWRDFFKTNPSLLKE